MNWLTSFIGFLFAFVFYFIYTFLDARLGSFGTALSYISLSFFIFTCAIFTAIRFLKKETDDPSLGSIFFYTAVFSFLYYLSPLYLFIALAIIILMRNPKFDEEYNAKGLSKFFIYVLLAIYIPLQLWFITAYTNTFGSDKDLLQDEFIRDAPLIFASLGFGFFFARLLNLKGTNFFIPIILFSVIFYANYDSVIDYWAEKQSLDTKKAALIGLAARSAIANTSSMPGEADKFKSPEEVRLTLALLPSKITQKDNNQIADFINIVDQSGYFRKLVNNSGLLINENNYKNLKGNIEKAWYYYGDYLKLAAMSQDTDEKAKDFIAEPLEKYGRRLIPRNAPGYEKALTCGTKSIAIIREIDRSLPLFTSRQNALRTERGRRSLLSKLSSKGLKLPDDWRYKNDEQLYNDLAYSICNLGNEKVIEFQKYYKKTFFNEGRLYDISEFIEIVTGVKGISSPDEFTYEFFKEEMIGFVNDANYKQIMDQVDDFLEAHGNDVYAAAIMPAVGIFTGSIVLAINIILLLINASRSKRYGATILIIASTLTLFYFYTINNKKDADLSLMNVQSDIHRYSNFVFTKLGLNPRLGDFPDEYQTAQSQAHIHAAQYAIENNYYLTPPSQSALFHITLAKYYDSDSDTEWLVDKIIESYIDLGADSPDSPLYDRYLFITRNSFLYN